MERLHTELSSYNSDPAGLIYDLFSSSISAMSLQCDSACVCVICMHLYVDSEVYICVAAWKFAGGFALKTLETQAVGIELTVSSDCGSRSFFLLYSCIKLSGISDLMKIQKWWGFFCVIFPSILSAISRGFWGVWGINHERNANQSVLLQSLFEAMLCENLFWNWPLFFWSINRAGVRFITEAWDLIWERE